MNEKIKLKEDDKLTLYVDGMHCAACEMLIEKKFARSKYVKNVKANLLNYKVKFEIEKNITKDQLITELNQLVNSDGYHVIEENPKSKINKKDLLLGFLLAILIFGIFILIQKLGIANILGGENLSLPMVFLIGIVASLSSCMAVVGGLVLSISASYSQESRKKPLVLFHLSRILGFFFLGGILGLIGSAFNLSQNFYFITSILIFLVMIILGLNLLEIPYFRRFQLRIPKSVTSKFINQDKITSSIAPVFLGLLTFFLPCGFTQSMQFQAIGSGNIIKGALIMFVFSLGTFPVLSLISFTSAKLSLKDNAKLFFKTAGFLVILFAVFNFITTLVSIGAINPIFNL